MSPIALKVTKLRGFERGRAENVKVERRVASDVEHHVIRNACGTATHHDLSSPASRRASIEIQGALTLVLVPSYVLHDSKSLLVANGIY